MTETTTTRQKAPSRELLDPDAYPEQTPERLREERQTINNRLSGLGTQIRRAGDDTAKAKPLERRKRDLEGRRKKIAAELAKRPQEPPADAA